MRGLASGLADALGFLTIVPAGTRRGLGTAFFPLVGLMVGAAVALPLLLPLPALPRAALALVLWTVLTGGLHEDAWADCADAAWAPVERERRREILKDPRVGAHGLTATVLLLVGRLAGLAAAPPLAAAAALLVGRWAMVLAPGWFPPHEDSILGAFFAREARPLAASLTATAGLGILMLLVGSSALAAGPEAGSGALVLAVRLGAASVAGLVSAALLGVVLSRRLGGLNGDGYGAVGVTAELVVLWALLPWGAAA